MPLGRAGTSWGYCEEVSLVECYTWPGNLTHAQECAALIDLDIAGRIKRIWCHL